MLWYDYVKKTGNIPEWPYKVEYGKEKVFESDVLVIGGGVAGSRAAIEAVKRGASVVLAERGNARRSGQGGTGVDHWHGAVTNPCSKVTPEMYVDSFVESSKGYTNPSARYIIAKEGWDTLKECEDEMGVQIRDVEDIFKGAPFRDDATKLLFAYDYESRNCIRIFAHNIKPLLYKAMQKLGVNIQNRVCVTSLLTDGGKRGAKVIGATGVNTRTGEFYIFKAKAVVIATGRVGRLFNFTPEVSQHSSMLDMNLAGQGFSIGWKAGAEFLMMESVGPRGASENNYVPYSTGNCSNTYFGTPIVDAEGREVPYLKIDGSKVENYDEIFEPDKPEQGGFYLGIGVGLHQPVAKKYKLPDIDPDIPGKIARGEYKQPLYADFTKMPDLERRALFGLMIGNEGKTRVPIYKNYTQWGFDPDKDMLLCPPGEPQNFRGSCWWSGMGKGVLNGMNILGSGYLTDWRLQTSLEGLYVAGGQPVNGSGCHGEAQTTGRYAGRQAAKYAETVSIIEPDKAQLEEEKNRCFAPLDNEDGIGWKELNSAIVRIMEDYCSLHRSEEVLKLGIKRMRELMANEGKNAYASNPHELGRLIECFGLAEVGEMIMEASLARKGSNTALSFYRNDFPNLDEPEWNCFISIKLGEKGAETKKMPLDYHLKAPFAPTLEENYLKYCEIGS